MRVRNNIFIENTIINTIKLANVGKLMKKRISTYIYKDDIKLDQIYKIESSKVIHFNVSGISKYIGDQLPFYNDSTYSKMRMTICMIVLQTLLKEYIVKDQSENEYYICAAKWLVNHQKIMRKIVGNVDISNLATVILQPSNLYNDIYNR